MKKGVDGSDCGPTMHSPLPALAQVYPPGDARVWLFSPHRDLGGARPADVIAEDRMDEVLAIIDRLQSAAYT